MEKLAKSITNDPFLAGTCHCLTVSCLEQYEQGSLKVEPARDMLRRASALFPGHPLTEEAIADLDIDLAVTRIMRPLTKGSYEKATELLSATDEPEAYERVFGEVEKLLQLLSVSMNNKEEINTYHLSQLQDFIASVDPDHPLMDKINALRE
jgi:hypothetical protein